MKELLTKIVPYVIGLAAVRFLSHHVQQLLDIHYKQKASNLTAGVIAISATYCANKAIEKLMAR